MKNGWLLAAAQILIVLVVAGKAEYEKRTLPREWLLTAPVDPERPLRGRYVMMRVQHQGATRVLDFYLPEDVPDPSRRAAGEELWAEVLVDPKGNLRPVRLGVKKAGSLTPLPLR